MRTFLPSKDSLSGTFAGTDVDPRFQLFVVQHCAVDRGDWMEPNATITTVQLSVRFYFLGVQYPLRFGPFLLLFFVWVKGDRERGRVVHDSGAICAPGTCQSLRRTPHREPHNKCRRASS